MSTAYSSKARPSESRKRIWLYLLSVFGQLTLVLAVWVAYLRFTEATLDGWGAALLASAGLTFAAYLMHSRALNYELSFEIRRRDEELRELDRVTILREALVAQARAAGVSEEELDMAAEQPKRGRS